MALKEVVKNIYTFANILSQAHQSTVSQWDRQSFNNALKWAKFCMKVEEETRDKSYRDILDKHIKSLTILLSPVSLLQIDLMKLKDSMFYLCKILSHEGGKSPHRFNVYKLLGEDITFDDNSTELQAVYIVDRLVNLQDVCMYTEQRYERFLEKVFHELLKMDSTWELITRILLVFTDDNRYTVSADKLLRKLLVLMYSSIIDINCRFWTIDRDLLCRLCSYDDELLDMLIQLLWRSADGMEPVYGLDDDGTLYKWRPVNNKVYFTYDNIVDILKGLVPIHPRILHNIQTTLRQKSESSYVNVYKDIIKTLSDITRNHLTCITISEGIQMS
ncbi:hypothetical protein ACF0H5_011055 [Mactra antiquata]